MMGSSRGFVMTSRDLNVPLRKIEKQRRDIGHGELGKEEANPLK